MDIVHNSAPVEPELAASSRAGGSVDHLRPAESELQIDLAVERRVVVYILFFFFSFFVLSSRSGSSRLLISPQRANALAWLVANHHVEKNRSSFDSPRYKSLYVYYERRDGKGD